MNYLELLHRGEYDRLVREALPLVETDRLAELAFLRLCQGRYNFFLLEPATVEMLQEQAKAGNRYAQYAFARYHLFVRNTEESVMLSYENMLAAARQNLPDAVAGLASCAEYGDIGVVDRENAAAMMDDAFNAGSELAAIYRLKEYCFGRHFIPAQPDKAVELAEQLIARDEAAGIEPNGFWFYYRASAREDRFGRTAITISNDYQKALALGILDASSDLILAAGYGDESRVLTLTKEYERLINEGMERLYAGAFYFDAVAALHEYEVLQDPDNDLGHEQENRLPKLLQDCHDRIFLRFTQAGELGDNSAYELLGDFYYEGSYGFEQNYQLAYAAYARGIVRDHVGCVEKAWKMMRNHYIDRPIEEMDELALLGARWDIKRLLAETVIAYQEGRLTEFADEITKYYEPIFDAPEFTLDSDEDWMQVIDEQLGDEDDDFEEDDGRYDAWA